MNEISNCLWDIYSLIDRTTIPNDLEWTVCGETRLKSVCLGMYRRMSLLVFSTHPFCYEEYASAK